MRSLTDTFKALSDQTRLEMIALLLENEELCVCDFVGSLGLTQSKCSRHLRYLYHAGLVEYRRDGVWMHYRLAGDMTAAQRAILDALEVSLSQEDRDRLRLQLGAWQARKAEKEDGLSCAELNLKGV